MKTYLFCTTATMKEYNSRKWWIDSKIVRDMEIQAENVLSALNIWRARVSSVDISANAIKNRDPMFCDFKDGSTKQVGYVITASTDFETDNYKWSKQYIDLWVTIKEIAFCDFEETA